MKATNKFPLAVNSKEGGIVSDIIQLKLKELALKKKRRVLLEEIHRQYLEGEAEPKRRRKNPKKCADEKIVSKAEAVKLEKVKADSTVSDTTKIEETVEDIKVGDTAVDTAKLEEATEVE